MILQLGRIDLFFPENTVVGGHYQLIYFLDGSLITPLNGLGFFPVDLESAVDILPVLHQGSRNRISHPIGELAVFVISDFRSIHPETANRSLSITCSVGEVHVLIAGPHVESSRWNIDHPGGLREIVG